MSQNTQDFRSPPSWLHDMIKPPSGDSNLANEITELRREIAQLRTDLAPVPSLILTGRAAIEEFKKLRGVGA